MATGSAPGFVQGCNIAVAQDGTIYVVYERTGTNGNGGIELRRNTAGGDSGGWDSTTYTVGNWTRFTLTCGDNFVQCIKGYNGNTIRVTHYPSIATDPETGVHVVWTTNNTNTGADVLYANADPCCSFSTPVKIDLETNKTDQWEPAIAISNAAVIHVSAYDRRFDANNTWYRQYDYYCYYSFTACDSQSLWFNKQITLVNSTNLDTTDGTTHARNFVDDYHGIATSSEASPGREAYIVWTDSRNINPSNLHNFDIYFDMTKS
ncbi:hypothetical protein [Candidatus Nitrososphaera evergladensis]|uniref:hypothetical protein n=1 Tax=Candidatus Nitrososphaera evergladensis TaxID=1459637 RepID=UPI0011E5E3B8|nr:hypothetical protein [Candidatus Nitrososphaera evergladensis]